MPRPDAEFAWPVYFAKRPLVAKRITLQAGQMFPLQDKGYIRGLGAAYGVPDAATRPFSELDYVDMLNVRTDEMAKAIQDNGLNLTAAKKLLGEPSGEKKRAA